MSSKNTMSWHQANQAYLMRELNGVRQAVERCVGATSARPIEEAEKNRAIIDAAPSDLNPPPALERLCHAFGLSQFERAILFSAPESSWTQASPGSLPRRKTMRAKVFRLLVWR